MSHGISAPLHSQAGEQVAHCLGNSRSPASLGAQGSGLRAPSLLGWGCRGEGPTLTGCWTGCQEAPAGGGAPRALWSRAVPWATRTPARLWRRGAAWNPAGPPPPNPSTLPEPGWTPAMGPCVARGLAPRTVGAGWTLSGPRATETVSKQHAVRGARSGRAPDGQVGTARCASAGERRGTPFCPDQGRRTDPLDVDGP